jgi:predicted nucleic acid-binding protein
MTKFVIGPDVALLLAERGLRIAAPHRLLAPTLLRSHVLAMLFDEVRHGRLERKAAERRLDHLRSLQIRLLGDRVLQGLAWKLAEQLGWHDTFVAEYLALTRLQADAFVTLDDGLARTAASVVAVAPLDALVAGAR